jgi:hypothetical protein
MNKRKALLLIVVLAVSSLIAVKPAPAEASIPKPSVPEFTLKLADHSYDVPPSTITATDPYTGKQTVTTKPGYHVENKTIEITIKNQPFVSSSNLTNLYYDVRVKGHFGENWTELYSYSEVTVGNLPLQSASENTVISTPQDYPAGGQVDFQVEAIIGTVHPLYNTNFAYWEYETSGWSNTQTITIPTSTPSSPDSPSPASTPDQTSEPTTKETPQTLQLAAIIGTVIAVAVVAAGLLVYFKKRNRQAPKASPDKLNNAGR